ncbi:MAG: Fe-S cluster assembly protein HesB [Planctomycetes bacterium]|nr:Fe-S cluster assembly protein HesB [Planctomycetota bacterium]
MPTHRTRLRVAAPFDWRLCLFGHGWIALAPHRFDEQAARWHTVLRLGRATADAVVQPKGAGELEVALTARNALTRDQLAAARAQVRHMMRLDDDLAPFYAMCRRDPSRRWIARRGGGRLLRSSSAFEDLMKLLFTTNVTWSATEAMTNNLVGAAGSKAPSGARAFPTPRQCLRDEAFYRDVVRCGYRAQAAIELAEQFATGVLDDAAFYAEPSSERLWTRLCNLRGFGPYAAGQMMRLCGHYQHLAIDSWCRARFADLDGKAKPPSDLQIAQRYQGFAPFQGLVMWCDLTADWHGEGP